MDKTYIEKAIIVPLGEGKVSLGVYRYLDSPIVLIEWLKEQQEMFSSTVDDNIDKDTVPVMLKFNTKDGLKALYDVLHLVEGMLQGESDTNEDR